MKKCLHDRDTNTKCFSISQFINYPYCWTYSSHALHKNWIKFFKNQIGFFFLLKLKITLFYLLTFVLIRFTTCCRSLSLIFICSSHCHSLYHLLSFAVTCCHSLSLVVPLAATQSTTRLSFHKESCKKKLKSEIKLLCSACH